MPNDEELQKIIEDAKKNKGALVDPKSQEDWELALKNPLSPIFKLVMNILEDKAIEQKALLEIFIDRWIRICISQDRLQREQILDQQIKHAQELAEQAKDYSETPTSQTAIKAEEVVKDQKLEKFRLEDEIKNLKKEVIEIDKKIEEKEKEFGGIKAEMKELDENENAQTRQRIVDNNISMTVNGKVVTPQELADRMKDSKNPDILGKVQYGGEEVAEHLRNNKTAQKNDFLLHYELLKAASGMQEDFKPSEVMKNRKAIAEMAKIDPEELVKILEKLDEGLKNLKEQGVLKQDKREKETKITFNEEQIDKLVQHFRARNEPPGAKKPG